MFHQIYDLLNIKNLNERGESFYNPYLGGVINDFEKQGLAVESDGATAVFLDGVRFYAICCAAVSFLG